MRRVGMSWSVLRSAVLAHVGLAWPWAVCGLVAALLVGHQREALAARERPVRHPLEMRANGVRHVRHGDFAARVECEASSCRVQARIGRGIGSREISFVAARGRWVTVLEHGSVLHAIDHDLAPRYRPANPQNLAWAILATLFFGPAFLVWAACSHGDMLSWRGARPCRVTGGTVEMLDGAEPSVARTTPGIVEGSAWARVVEAVPPSGYRERPLPFAVVTADTKALDAAIGRGRALMALSALTAIWLVTCLAWS